MKLIGTSDWHLHNFKDYANVGSGGINSRAQWILYAIRQILHYAHVYGIKHVLFAGDMFHQRGKVEVSLYNAVYDTIEDFFYNYGVTVIMIPGNHDNIDNSDKPEFSFRKFSEIAWVVDDFDVIGVKSDLAGKVDVNVFCAPFVKNVKKTKDKLEEFANRAKNMPNSILMSHIGVTGGVTGKEHYALKDMYAIRELKPECYKYVVLGHYHTPQVLPGTRNAFYCGMPLQRDFNDEGSARGFFVMDTDKRCDIQFVEIPMTPKFISVEYNEKAKYDWNDMTGNFYKFSYKGHKELEKIASLMPEGALYKTVPRKEYKSTQRVNNVSVDMNFNTIVANWAKEFRPEAEDVGIDILNEVMTER